MPDTLPVGPFYLVHDDEVIGLEYYLFFTPGEEIELPDLPVGAIVDHIVIEYAPNGEGHHVEVYLWFVEEVPHH